MFLQQNPRRKVHEQLSLEAMVHKIGLLFASHVSFASQMVLSVNTFHLPKFLNLKCQNFFVNPLPFHDYLVLDLVSLGQR